MSYWSSDVCSSDLLLQAVAKSELAHPVADNAVNAVVDAFALARQGGSVQGTVPLVRLARAVEGLPEQPAGEAGRVAWSVRGETGTGAARTGIAAGHPLLHLHVQPHTVRVGQRCHPPYVYSVAS